MCSDGLNLREGKNNQPDDLKGNDVAFISARTKLITALVSALQQRFIDNPGIIEACSVMNLSAFPMNKDEAEGKTGQNRKTHGETQIAEKKKQ